MYENFQRGRAEAGHLKNNENLGLHRNFEIGPLTILDFTEKKNLVPNDFSDFTEKKKISKFWWSPQNR